MDINQQINLEHLLFVDRKCRTCGEIKSLIEDFYLTRKNRKGFPSAYSYECKECTVNRIINSRKKHSQKAIDYQYPDW